MNLVSISCGGLADWGFGILRDRQVPLNVIFGVFAGLAVVSIVLVVAHSGLDRNSGQRSHRDDSWYQARRLYGDSSASIETTRRRRPAELWTPSIH